MVQFVKIMLLALLFILTTLKLWGADTGKTAAMKYFSAKGESNLRGPQSLKESTTEYKNLLALSVGTLISSQSYQWDGKNKEGWSVEGSYLRQGENISQGFHLEYQKFNDSFAEELSKVSFLISFTFPARVSFPVYIAVAAGPGYFIKQRKDESEFSLDYKAFLGLRLNQSQSQYFVQSGVKNHVHVLSDGQFIGWFVSSGVAYKF
jgi:hypothetical protein